MRTTTRIYTIVVFALITSFGLTGISFGGPKDLFSPEIKKSVDRAIAAWQRNDQEPLKGSLEKLTLNETYLLVTGLSNENLSYLQAVPKSLNHNLNNVAAYLFLLRTERQEGIQLRQLNKLFEGKKFVYQEESF